VSIYKRGDEEISYLVGIVSLVNYGAFPLVAVIVKVIRNYPTKKMRCDNKLVISSEKAAITYANLMWRFNIWIFRERKENEKIRTRDIWRSSSRRFLRHGCHVGGRFPVFGSY